MKKIGIFFLVILLLVGIPVVIYFFIPQKDLTEGERAKALTKILGRKPNLDEKNIPTGDAEYIGKYISFKYPNAAKIYSLRPENRENDDSYLEDFIYDLENPKMAFFMETLKASQSISSVSDFPNVKLRQQVIGQYTEEKLIVGGLNGLSFEKSQGGIEKTAYFYSDGKIFSISVQGNDLVEVRKLFDKTIQSMRFL